MQIFFLEEIISALAWETREFSSISYLTWELCDMGDFHPGLR